MKINIQNLGTLTSTSFTFKGNQVYVEFTDNGVKTTYSCWDFTGNVTLNLMVTMLPDPPKQSKESVYQEVKQHLEENLLIDLVVIEPLSFASFLVKTHQSAIEQKPIAPPSSLRDKIIAATLIITMALLAPIGV